MGAVCFTLITPIALFVLFCVVDSLQDSAAKRTINDIINKRGND